MKFPSKGLYAITQTESKSIAQVLTEVEAALKGGAGVLQYRDKSPIDALALAQQLLTLCHHYEVPLLINDDIDLALAIGADGVHLGRDDCDLVSARQLLGAEAIIGISCYNDLEKAMTMAEQGADYVAFGRFFPSGSKPLASPAEIETLRLARQQLTIPIVAIGGILPENASPLLEAGADLLAVIGGLFDYEAQSAAQQYLSLFHK